MAISPSALQRLIDDDLSSAFPRFAPGGEVPTDATPGEFAAFALSRSINKKNVDSKERLADCRAADLFVQMNERCRDWEPRCFGDDVELATCIGEFQSMFLKCFETRDGLLLDMRSEAEMRLHHGPGASVDVDGTDWYSKSAAGNMSTTSSALYWMYYDQCLNFDLETSMENQRSKDYKTVEVRGSKLGFAEKNSRISRTRCTEPSLNMLYQLGTGSVIEELILGPRFNLWLESQPDFNRKLALRGSVDGSFATIDLTSASDCLATKFFNWLCQYKEIRDWFLLLRSSETLMPSTREGEKPHWVELHLLSSMGNGFTFPLMTLVLTCLVHACYKTLGIRVQNNRTRCEWGNPVTVPGNYGVFGDDIIVVKDACALLMRALDWIGYIPNNEKSFVDGPFRESCGADCYIGHQVRGVYVKTLKTEQAVYTAINLLTAWSCNWGVALLGTISALRNSVRFRPVPAHESVDAGIIVPFHTVSDRKFGDNMMVLYHCCTPVPSEVRITRGCKPPEPNTPAIERRKDQKRPLYIAGVILGYVGGYIRNQRVGRRSDDTRYEISTRATPGWDCAGESQAGFTPVGWARYDKYYAFLYAYAA